MTRQNRTVMVDMCGGWVDSQRRIAVPDHAVRVVGASWGGLTLHEYVSAAVGVA